MVCTVNYRSMSGQFTGSMKPILASNRTRRIDFALFMVAALEDEGLVQQAPAIVGCQAPSALAHGQLQLAARAA